MKRKYSNRKNLSYQILTFLVRYCTVIETAQMWHEIDIRCMWDVIEWKNDCISVQREKDSLISGTNTISGENQSPTSRYKKKDFIWEYKLNIKNKSIRKLKFLHVTVWGKSKLVVVYMENNIINKQ